MTECSHEKDTICCNCAEGVTVDSYQAGRKAGLEEAAKVSEDHNCSNECNVDLGGGGCCFIISQAIRNLANQAKDEKGEV